MARMVLLVVAVVLGGMSAWLAAQRQGGAATQIAIDGDDIAGVVTSARGPEAGVWVIAETTDTPTKFRKIVVTDDRGRYLLPDLPTKATFSIWVRGYGLVDSKPVRATPAAALADGHRGSRRPRRGPHLSGELLVFAHRHSSGKGIPWHRADRQRHRSRDADPASLDQSDQGELQRLSPDGQPGHARDPEGARDVCLQRRLHGTRGCRSGRTGRA